MCVENAFVVFLPEHVVICIIFLKRKYEWHRFTACIANATGSVNVQHMSLFH